MVSLHNDHVTLPPMVKGKLNGHLTIKVDDVMWCRRSPGDVIVESHWWGSSETIKFRPVDVSHLDQYSRISSSSQPPKEVSVTFDIRTSLTLFENYLKNCDSLGFHVIKLKSQDVVGTVTVSEISQIIKEKMYQRYFPIINAFGNRIGDLHIGFSLWMKSSQKEKENEENVSETGKPKHKIGKRKSEKGKICKRHSNMLKQINTKSTPPETELTVKQSTNRKSPVKDSSKLIEGSKSLPHVQELTTTDLIAPPNTVRSETILDGILVKGEKLRNAMILSVFEDSQEFDNKEAVLARSELYPLITDPIVPQEPYRLTTDPTVPQEPYPLTSDPIIPPLNFDVVSAADEVRLMDYLSGANMTPREEEIALETLRTVSPTESALALEEKTRGSKQSNHSSDEKQAPQSEMCAPVENSSSDAICVNVGAEQRNDRARNVECVNEQLTCTTLSTDRTANSEHTSCQSTNKTQDASDELQAIFAAVNCCRLTIDSLKLKSTGVATKVSNTTKNIRRVTCDGKRVVQTPPGVVYFVEYSFCDSKQVKSQYRNPVRYSTKKQAGQVIFFGQNQIHNLSKPFSMERLKRLMLNAQWRIFWRHLNQRVPSLFGTVFIPQDLDIRLESTFNFPVQSHAGITVGELCVKLELGKDKTAFGNLLLGERMLDNIQHHPGSVSAEVQTDFCVLDNETTSCETSNTNTHYTGCADLEHCCADKKAIKRNMSVKNDRCHHIVVELHKITHCSLLQRSTKDKTCYIDYKFPENDEKTKKVHLSNRMFTTDVVSCCAEPQFHYRHCHLLNVDCLSSSISALAISGIAFSLWTRNYHPGIHDHMIATAFLPVATLCSLEHKYNLQDLKSILKESISLPLTMTQATSSEPFQFSHSNVGYVHLTISYRQNANQLAEPCLISRTNNDEPLKHCSHFSVTDFTRAKSCSNFVERLEENSDSKDELDKNCCRKSNDIKFASSDSIINKLKEIKSHKYTSNGCDCQNYHRLFKGEKKHDRENCKRSREEFISQGCFEKAQNNVVEINNDVDLKKLIDASKENSIYSLLDSGLAENYQKRLRNFHKPLETTKIDRLETDNCSLNNENRIPKWKSRIIESFMVHPNDSNKKPDDKNENTNDNKLPNDCQLVDVVYRKRGYNLQNNAELDNILSQTRNILGGGGKKDGNKIEDNMKQRASECIYQTSLKNPICINDQRISESKEELEHGVSPVDSLKISSELNDYSFKGSIEETDFLSLQEGRNSSPIPKTNSENLTQEKKLHLERRLNWNADEIPSERPCCNIDVSQSVPSSELDNVSPELRTFINNITIREISNSNTDKTASFEPVHKLGKSQSSSSKSVDVVSEHQRILADDLPTRENSERKEIDRLITDQQLYDNSDLRVFINNLSLRNNVDWKQYDQLLSELKMCSDSTTKHVRNRLETLEIMPISKDMGLAKSNSDSDIYLKYNERHKLDVNTKYVNDANILNEIESVNREMNRPHNSKDGAICNHTAELNQRDVVKSIESNDDIYGVKTVTGFVESEMFVDNCDNNIVESLDQSSSKPQTKPDSTLAVDHEPTLPTSSSQTFFKAKLEIERAFHLPSISHTSAESEWNESPSTFAKVQTTCNSLDDSLTTSTVKNSCSPVWMANFEVDLPIELLNQSFSRRLVVHVFNKLESVAELIGLAALNLSILTSGLPYIRGWFNLLDIMGNCKGQIKINVIPVDDLSEFQDAKCSKENISKCITPKDLMYIARGTFNKFPSSVNSIKQLYIGLAQTSTFCERDKLLLKNDYEENSDAFKSPSSTVLASSLREKLSELDFFMEGLKKKMNSDDNSTTHSSICPSKLAVNNNAALNKNDTMREEIRNGMKLKTKTNSNSEMYYNFPTDSNVLDFNESQTVLDAENGDLSSTEEGYKDNATDGEGSSKDSPFRTYSIHSDEDGADCKSGRNSQLSIISGNECDLELECNEQIKQVPGGAGIMTVEDLLRLGS